jgi:hypothetical protein
VFFNDKMFSVVLLTTAATKRARKTAKKKMAKQKAPKKMAILSKKKPGQADIANVELEMGGRHRLGGGCDTLQD